MGEEKLSNSDVTLASLGVFQQLINVINVDFNLKVLESLYLNVGWNQQHRVEVEPAWLDVKAGGG